MSRTAARKSCSPEPEPTWGSLSQAKRKEAGPAKRRSGSNHNRRPRRAARGATRNVRVDERRCDMRPVSPEAAIISSPDRRARAEGAQLDTAARPGVSGYARAEGLHILTKIGSILARPDSVRMTRLSRALHPAVTQVW